MSHAHIPAEDDSRRSGEHRHEVQFYESNEYLKSAVSRYLAPGFRHGNGMIVIARPEHRKAFREQLAAHGCDVASAIERGQFREYDAEQALAQFMDPELPNPERFESVIGPLIDECRRGREHAPLLAYGEMVDIIWRSGRHEAAIRLEQLWNGLSGSRPFDLLCAYSLNGFYKGRDHRHFEDICRSHSRVYPTERYMQLEEKDRLRRVSLLEQKALALEAEIAQRAKVEQALLNALQEKRHAQAAQSFLSAVVESADDAIIAKTLDGIITTWNPGAQRLFGYSAEEVIGKPVTILFPSECYDEEPQILAKIRRGERIDHFETRRTRKDGTIIDISLTISPIRNSAGEIIGASKVARDITLRKRLQAERDELLERERIARSEAESVNRVKDEFLAVLSHELRTPLNAVLGWVSILESRNDPSLFARGLDVIKRNATVQKRMIEDLLDVARILTGKMVVASEPLDMRMVVSGALESINPAASAKMIRLDKDIAAELPLIKGDADRLQQVVWNLLSNAIKFTPENGRVEVRLVQRDSYVEFCVGDTGQGIAPELLPHVFDRFVQGDSTTTRSHSGLGIGLAVVRHVVEAHGGSVDAESPGQGLGATFRVRLPMIS